VTFFEPRPPPRHPDVAPWRPPLWDRPSEGTLGAIVPVGEVVVRDETLIVSIDHLRAFPNGFGIEVVFLRHPDAVHRDHRPPIMDRTLWPRIGVRFSDGRKAGTADGGLSAFGVPKDAAGIPTEPVIHSMGGGGGETDFHMRAWVFPLPPGGPVDIYVEVGELPEGHSTVDGALIREAAGRAQVIWS